MPRSKPIFLGITALLLAVAACSPPAASSPSGAAGSPAAASIKVCVIHNKADHPSIQAIIKGMDDTAKFYPVEITYFDPAGDPQKQVSQLNDCVARKFDVILPNAVDPAAIVPGIKAASEAGIPVVMHNADTNEEGRQYTEAMITPDLRAQGVAVGEIIANTMPKDAKMVVISGIPGQTGVAERKEGAMESLEGTGIQFLDDQSADWDKDKALQVMQAFLTRYPDIQGVYALDDFMAFGAIEAIKAANKMDQIKVYGVGGVKEACESIKNGELQGSAFHLSYLVGVQAIRASWDVTHNLVVPKDITFPSIGIDKDNVDQYQQLCW